MLGAHRLVGLAHVDGVPAVERSFQGVERGAPLLVASKQIGELSKRVGLGVRRRRMLISGISGRRASRDHFIAIVRLGVIGRGSDPGVSEPVGRVLGRGGDRCACELLGGREIASGDSPGGFAEQLLRRLALDLIANRRGRDAQRLREPHGVARHVLAREGLGLGGAGASGKQDEQEGERAQSVKHRRPINFSARPCAVNLARGLSAFDEKQPQALSTNMARPSGAEARRKAHDESRSFCRRVVEFGDSLDPAQSLILAARSGIALCPSPKPSSLTPTREAATLRLAADTLNIVKKPAAAS